MGLILSRQSLYLILQWSIIGAFLVCFISVLTADLALIREQTFGPQLVQLKRLRGRLDVAY